MITENSDYPFEHPSAGYHWERNKIKEEEIEGYVKCKNGKVYLQGDFSDHHLKHDGKPKLSIIDKLRHLSGKLMRIKLEVYEINEVEETSDFDPFEERRKN